MYIFFVSFAGHKVGGIQYFEIDSTSGQIVISHELDREAKDEYNIILRVYSLRIYRGLVYHLQRFFLVYVT